ncbi:MAG: hypothetical protein ACK52V_04680 [Betaproteobacteria bacterium]
MKPELRDALLIAAVALLGVISYQLNEIYKRVPLGLGFEFHREWKALHEDVRRLTDKVAGPRIPTIAERCALDAYLPTPGAPQSEECRAFYEQLLKLRIEQDRQRR